MAERVGDRAVAAPPADPSLDAALGAAHAMYNAGDYEGCAAACVALATGGRSSDAGAAPAPATPAADDVRLLLLCGAAYFQLRQYEDSLRCSARAVELQPTMAEAYSNMANVYKEQGDAATALSLYSRAIALKPDFAVRAAPA